MVDRHDDPSLDRLCRCGLHRWDVFGMAGSEEAVKRTLFLDMDGVLADFDTGYERAFGVRSCKLADNVDWAAVRALPGFYEALPPMADMGELWAAVERHKPIVLTGVPSSVPEAPGNKQAWVRKNLGANVEVRCCASKDKALHAKPGDILIDDWEKYRHRWIRAGGVWITHVSAASSIQQLAAALNTTTHTAEGRE